jgi:MFS family permease
MGIDGETSASQDMMESCQLAKPKVGMKRILKRGVVWNLGGIYFARAIGYTIFMTFAVAYLEEIGWPKELAAAVFGIWGALQIPSPIVWGIVADHMPKKYAFAIALALDAVGVFVFLCGSTGGCYLGAAIIGFADVGIPTIMAASMADYFEPTTIGTTFGFVTLIFGIGCIVAPTIGGYLGDVTGTLHTAIVLSLGAIIAALILALVLKKPSAKPMSQ